MKKSLILILIMSIVLPFNVWAKKLPTIEVGSCYAYKNERIILPITLKNNLGFHYLGAKIRYDSTKLKYVQSSIKGLTAATLKKIDINSHKTITLYALSTVQTMNDNGEIANIEFEVIDDTVEEIPVEIQVDNFGKEEEDIEINAKDGLVKVINHGKKGETLDFAKEFTGPNEEMVEEKEEKEKKKEITTKENTNTDSKTKTKKKSKTKNKTKTKSKQSNIIFKTSDENVATVDQNGTVTFKKDGVVEIEAVDNNDNLLLKKKYKVDNKLKNHKEDNHRFGIFISCFIIVMISGIMIFFLLKRKK